jgi:hypothetical protein
MHIYKYSFKGRELPCSLCKIAMKSSWVTTGFNMEEQSDVSEAFSASIIRE